MSQESKSKLTSRRGFLTGVAASSVAGLAGCSGNSGSSGGTSTAGSAGGTTMSTTSGNSLTPLEIHDTNSTSPLFEGGLDAGVWEEEGIDLTVKYPGFEAQGQALVQDRVNTSNMSLLPHIDLYNRGEDLVLYGWPGSLQGVPGMYTRADSNYESIPDLEGERVGVWSWGSSTVQSFQAIIANEYGLNLRQDFQTTTAAPPALVGLLEDGEVDAIINVFGLSVSMDAQPDKFQRIARLNNIWQESSGHNLPITAWFSYQDWYENETDLATRFMRGTRKAVEHWRSNTAEILQKHGSQAGIEGEASIEVVSKLADNGQVFAKGTADGYLDATWEYLELMKEQGAIDTVPSQDEILRHPLE